MALLQWKKIRITLVVHLSPKTREKRLTTMHALAALTLLGSLASGVLATCDASCSPNTIPTCSKDGDTCLAPSVPVKASER